MCKAGHGEDVEVDKHFPHDAVAGQPKNVLADKYAVGGIAAIYKSMPVLSPETTDGSRILDGTEQRWPFRRRIKTSAYEKQREDVMESSVEGDGIESPVGD